MNVGLWTEKGFVAAKSPQWRRQTSKWKWERYPLPHPTRGGGGRRESEAKPQVKTCGDMTHSSVIMFILRTSLS